GDFPNPGDGNPNVRLQSTSWNDVAVNAGFPDELMPAATATNRLMRFNQGNGAKFDQIQCILRPVGTFGVSPPEVGLTTVTELRQDMAAAGQGAEPNGN